MQAYLEVRRKFLPCHQRVISITVATSHKVGERILKVYWGTFPAGGRIIPLFSPVFLLGVQEAVG